MGDSNNIRINLNEPIKVKLTQLGKDIYYHRFDSLNRAIGEDICKPSYPVEDEDGYTEFQLWYFMNLYGDFIDVGSSDVIDPIEIVYVRER